MEGGPLKGVTMSGRPADVDAGCVVTEPCHQPLDEGRGHLAAADVYTTLDHTSC